MHTELWSDATASPKKGLRARAARFCDRLSKRIFRLLDRRWQSR